MKTGAACTTATRYEVEKDIETSKKDGTQPLPASLMKMPDWNVLKVLSDLL
jgi:hypothetical protein